MKAKKEISSSISASNKSNSNGDNKVHKVSKKGKDLYKLQIAGKNYYSEYMDSFEIDQHKIKCDVKDLPENVEINFVPGEYYRCSIVTEGISISIQRENDEKYRATINLNIDSDNGHSDYMSTLFHCLKREVILLRKEMSPIIEDESQDYLTYSIYIEGETIEELIRTAVAFNESISKEIETAIDKTPRFLADYLGIDKSNDLFDSLENFHTN